MNRLELESRLRTAPATTISGATIDTLAEIEDVVVAMPAGTRRRILMRAISQRLSAIADGPKETE